jgi:hypothetical protein
LAWLYGIAAGVCGLYAIAFVNEWNALVELEELDTRAAARDYIDATDVSAAMAGLYLLTVIGVGVVTIVWLWRAVANLDLWPNPPRRLGPGWAIGGWIIPIAGWIIPKQLLNDAWRGASAEGTGGRPWSKIAVPGILTGWWACWIAGSLLLTVGGNLSGAEEFDTAKISVALSGLGAATLVGAAVCAIFAVRTISERQHAAAATVGLDPALAWPSM